MEAQPILPVKAPGVLKQESAGTGMSDVFQAMLREHETRGLFERQETARSLAAQNRFEPDAGRRPAEPRETREDDRPDAPRETREDERYAEPRDDRPVARDIEVAERRARSDGSHEPRPYREGPDRGVDRDGEVPASEAGAERTDEATAASGGPDEDAPSGRPGDGAPNPLESDALAFAAKPGTATDPAEAAPRLAEVAGGVTAQTPAAARMESAKSQDPVTGAPRATLTPAPAAAGPRAALGGAAETPGLSQAEVSKPGTQIAVNATQGNPPAAQATAGAAVETALGKRPGAPGPQAGAATAPSEPLRGPAIPDKGTPASVAANAQLAQANRQQRSNSTAVERGDNTGHRTGAPAAKDPAVPLGRPDANQATRNGPGAMAPFAKGTGRQTPPAHGPGASAQAQAQAQAQVGLTGFDPLHAAARAPGARAAPTPVADRPVTPGDVAVNIQRAAARGEDRIRIRLHPAELGQVDVRLKVGADGIVRAIVQVDRPETLDIMQRDARGLERALQDAGLKTDSGSLSFNLRDNAQGGPQERDGKPPAIEGEDSQSNMQPVLEETEIPVHTGRSSRALDIRV